MIRNTLTDLLRLAFMSRLLSAVKHSGRVFSFILILSGFTADFAKAAVYQLYTKTDSHWPQAIQNYDPIVRSLVEGDVVIFSDGSRFQLGEFLGEGTSTRIFSIGENKVIRLGMYYPEGRQLSPVSVIDYYLQGYKTLNQQKAPTVKVFEAESLLHEYVIAEKLDKVYTFQEFNIKSLRHPESGDDRIWEEFYKFVEGLSGMISIGDFHLEQMLYTRNRGWVLIDWSEWGRPLSRDPESIRHPFIDLNIRHDVKQKINSTILRARKKLLRSCESIL